MTVCRLSDLDTAWDSYDINIIQFSADHALYGQYIVCESDNEDEQTGQYRHPEITYTSL